MRKLYAIASLALVFLIFCFAMAFTPAPMNYQPANNTGGLLYAYCTVCNTPGVYVVSADANGNLVTTSGGGSITLSGVSAVTVLNFPTPLPTATLTLTPVLSNTSFSVNATTSATPNIYATAVPSATVTYPRVDITFNNPGTGMGGFIFWIGTNQYKMVGIAPGGAFGVGSNAMHIPAMTENVGLPMSISGPDTSLGASAGATINGRIYIRQQTWPDTDYLARP